MPHHDGIPEADWLGFCRRAGAAVGAMLRDHPTTRERAVETGRGEGGDIALVIDRGAEEAVFSELEALGEPVTAISEERGEVAIAGGGTVRVVIDPIDGSLNAKRELPFASLSIAVASGPSMADVELGYVAELEPSREWWARRGEGAWRDGERLGDLEPGPLELLAIEAARPDAVAESAAAIATFEETRRVRSLGSIAVTLCLIAAGRIDGMVSLRSARSVDVAAGQLLVSEVGGAVAFPEAGEEVPLGLDMRSRVLAARDPELLERLLVAF